MPSQGCLQGTAYCSRDSAEHRYAQLRVRLQGPPVVHMYTHIHILCFPVCKTSQPLSFGDSTFSTSTTTSAGTSASISTSSGTLTSTDQLCSEKGVALDTDRVTQILWWTPLPTVEHVAHWESWCFAQTPKHLSGGWSLVCMACTALAEACTVSAEEAPVYPCDFAPLPLTETRSTCRLRLRMPRGHCTQAASGPG